MPPVYATPAEFRALLTVDTDHGPRQLADVLDPWQAEDFAALDSSWQRVAGVGAGGHEGTWLERPRGHSKTSDLAVQCAWVLAFAPQRVTGIAAAADKDQAQLLRNAIGRLVQLNGWLAKLIDVQAYKVVNKSTQSQLEIIAADVPGSYGALVDFIIADEVTHWQKRELWDSLVSTAAKKSHSLLVVITNAGFRDSWQWAVREDIRQDADWHFNALDGPRASWITEKVLAKQERKLPSAVFRRYWLNQWSDGGGDALETDDIAAAITLTGPLAYPEQGFAYVLGTDLGIRHDSSSVVMLGVHVGHVEEIVTEREHSSSLHRAMYDAGLTWQSPDEVEEVIHEGTGRIKLCAVRTWKPPAGGRVSLAEVEAGIRELAERFNVAAIGIDPYQAEQMIQSLQRDGFPAEGVNFVAGNLQGMATETLDVFRNRRLDLYNDADLIADLKALRVVEKSYGFRLESARRANAEESGTRHADSATAFSIALLIAKNQRRNIRTKIQREGQIVIWPPSDSESTAAA
jgi:phage terminase large subunit-like protein